MEVSVIQFNVNGKDVSVQRVDPETTLASYLRNQLGLTGAKLSCECGACGACTVVIGKWDHKLGKAKYTAVNACVFPLYMAHHSLVLTIEGIGNPKKIHPIQDRLARIHGSQCEYHPRAPVTMEVSVIQFNVNGKDVSVQRVDPETTLASYLRNQLGLTGAKLSCECGACGACTVVIGKWDHKLGKAKYTAVNACVFPLYMAHHSLVLTIEGIGNPKKIHPIQDRLARIHGSQCGFCSPGFVMAAYALLRTNPNPTVHEMNQAIKGNLCRCTGYRPFLEALYSFTENGCSNGNVS
ncbi:2Fe-2S iron-sulfur cluster-binding domain protein [Ostertagia ostertagi]